MHVEMQTRDFGSREVDLGLCVNVDNGKIDLQIFKQVQSETKKQPKMYCKYRQVKTIHEARDFLGVSMGTILKIKTGSLPPDGPTKDVLRRSQERAPHTVEIMLQVTRETVVESMNRVDLGRTFGENIREIEPYTHFVQSITFGAEFVASIKITNHPDNVYSRAPEWEGPHLNKELLQLLKKFEEAGSTITIKYHDIGNGGWPARSLGSLTDFEKWLKDVQKKQIAKGVPLKFGVRSLQSIPELEVRLKVYGDRAPVVTQELKDFEEEYDDLCESGDILDDSWKKNSEVIKKNRPFERELKTFKADVSELKQE